MEKAKHALGITPKTQIKIHAHGAGKQNRAEISGQAESDEILLRPIRGIAENEDQPNRAENFH